MIKCPNPFFEFCFVCSVFWFADFTLGCKTWIFEHLSLLCQTSFHVELCHNKGGTSYCRINSPVIKFHPQLHFWGLRLVVLFWDGTAWVQEWHSLLGILVCWCSVMALWRWFVWNHIIYSVYHQTSNRRGVFIFSWFVGNEWCHFLHSLHCLCVDQIIFCVCMTIYVRHVFTVLSIIYTHSMAFDSSLSKWFID